jgi:glycosyltransferase involved in cell wall biosynthesis
MTDHPFLVPETPDNWFTRTLRRLNDAAGLQVGPASAMSMWRHRALSLAADQSAVDAIFLDSMNRLRGEGRKNRRFAVVSPMPPAETGIANSTLQTFVNCEGGADIFTRFENIHAYTHFACERQRLSLGIEMFELGALPLAAELRGYQALVICIGNSHHNLPFAALFSSLAAFRIGIPIIVHVHDPWLPEVWSWTSAAMGRSLGYDLEAVYGIKSKSERTSRQTALDSGVLGLCALIGEAPVNGILVNSAAAEAFVRHEFTLAKREIPISRGFLPVLPPLLPTSEQRRNESRKVPRIGTFGVPGASKRTGEIVSATATLVEDGRAESLLIAGYYAASLIEAIPAKSREHVHCVSSPANEALERLMIDIDVAVQLRRDNRGESSGIVPQLLALGKPVVVSAHGSFTEYGDAVVQVRHDADEEGIAAAIMEAYAKRDQLRDSAALYAQTHSPKRFTQLLGEFTRSLRA